MYLDMYAYKCVDREGKRVSNARYCAGEAAGAAHTFAPLLSVFWGIQLSVLVDSVHHIPDAAFILVPAPES